MDNCGSHTAAWHASLDNQIAGMPVYSEGYAQVGGSRRSKRSKRSKRKIKKGGYPQWFNKVPKNMSRKKYLKELKKKSKKRKSKKRSKYLKKKSKISTHKKSRSFRR